MIKRIFNFQFSFNSRKGFTVLETITAITILSLSISGVFSAVQQSLSQASMSKDEVKAFYLAREAVEIIRNKRDTNQIDRINGGGSEWLSGMSQDMADPCFFGKVCRVDAQTMALSYCGEGWGDCESLKQDPDTFLYNYSTGETTNFKREIIFESINAKEVAIIVRIVWSKGIISKEFKVKTILFDWMS